MSQTLTAAAGLTEITKLTTSSATAVYTADRGATRINSITACENSGATPSLTLEAYDGTSSYYIRRVVALSVGTQVVYSTPFTLPHNWSIRATSNNASGLIDVFVDYDDPSASGSPR